jgi:uncharacterized protein (TIGR00730 family)
VVAKRICVFAGSAEGDDPRYAAAAEAVGAELAERGIELVYGGAARGLMGRVASAALAAGGIAIGVIPSFLTGREEPHPDLTELRIVDSLHERVQLMADLSDGYIALPGGIGTFAELFEVSSFTLLGLDPKPCGALNVAGYFDPLARLLEQTIERGFLHASQRDLLLFDPAPAPLIERLADWTPPPTR